jgi:hypothetical protein
MTSLGIAVRDFRTAEARLAAVLQAWLRMHVFLPASVQTSMWCGPLPVITVGREAYVVNITRPA